MIKKTILFLCYLLFVSNIAFAKTKSIDITDVSVPDVQIINKIHYLTLDAKTSYGRGYQHGAALKYVIHKGIAQWKEWIKNTLKQSHPETEIDEFIHDTNFLTGIKQFTPHWDQTIYTAALSRITRNSERRRT